MSRNAWFHIGRALISISLLSYIALNIDWQQLGAVFANANLVWLPWVIAALVLDRVLAAYKLNILLTAQGMHITLVGVLMITLIGMFWGFFLPSSISIDFMIGYYVYKTTAQAADTASSILVDRVMGLVTLILLGIVGALLAGELITDARVLVVLVVLAAILAGGALFILREGTATWVESRWAPSQHKLITIPVKVYRSLYAFKRKPKILVYSFFLSCLLQLVRVLEIYLVALLFNVDISIWYIFVIVAIMTVLVVLPISIGGLGVREGTFVAMFVLAGYSSADGLAVSLGIFAGDVLLTLLGGLAYLVYRPPQPNSDMSTENK